jgi:hypothetical protein
MTLETEIYQILKKHRLGLKKREELIVDLLDFINKREEAITVTRCCESDSEQLLFSADEIVSKINEQTVLDGETFRVYFCEK